MTQVPRPLSRSDARVVPESAIAPAEPSTAHTAPATTTPTLPDALHNELALAIHEAGISLSVAGLAAEAIAARPKLLDALVAYRQQRQTIFVPADLDSLPPGAVILDYYGFAWQLSRYGDGHSWRRADGAQRDLYFEYDLPERVLWIPADITERPTDA